MAMTKTGEVSPGVTPDTENRLNKTATGDKRAQIEKLDDDVTKRLSARCADKLKK